MTALHIPRAPHELAAYFDLNNIQRITESVYVIRSLPHRRGRSFQVTRHEHGWTMVRINTSFPIGMARMPDAIKDAVLPAILLLDIPILTIEQRRQRFMNKVPATWATEKFT